MANQDREWCIDTVILAIDGESDTNDYMVHMSNSPTKADRPAAYVLPKVLASAPNNQKVLAAISRAITHTSEQVALWCAQGVGHYLVQEQETLLLHCAGAFAMRARLQVEREVRERIPVQATQNRVNQADSGRSKARRWVSNLLRGSKRGIGDEDATCDQTPSTDVRVAFVSSSIDAGKANGPGPVPIDGVEGSARWPRQWPGGGRQWRRPAKTARRHAGSGTGGLGWHEFAGPAPGAVRLRRVGRRRRAVRLVGEWRAIGPGRN